MFRVTGTGKRGNVRTRLERSFQPSFFLRTLHSLFFRLDWPSFVVIDFYARASDPRERSRLHVLFGLQEGALVSPYLSLIHFFFSYSLSLSLLISVQSLLFHRSIIVARNSFGPFVLFPVWLFFFSRIKR